MANNATGTMGTCGRQRVDGTFETIEYVRLTTHAHLKALIVDIATHFACCLSVSPRHILFFIHYLPLSYFFLRRATGAFLMFSRRARRWTDVGSVDSGAFGCGLALNRSP